MFFEAKINPIGFQNLWDLYDFTNENSLSFSDSNPVPQSSHHPLRLVGRHDEHFARLCTHVISA